MYTLHHLEQSRSQRLAFLLEELGADYDVKIYKRDSKSNLAPSDYAGLHALGKAPVLETPDGPLVETGAIAEYLVDRHPDADMSPTDLSPARTQYQYWMHASEGSLMPLLVMGLFFSRMETVPPFPIRPIVKKVTGRIRELYLTPSTARMMDYIEAHLSSSKWFAGDHFTAADIMMSFPLEAASARLGLSKSAHSSIYRWVDDIQARPAYQAAVQKLGKDELLT